MRIHWSRIGVGAGISSVALSTLFACTSNDSAPPHTILDDAGSDGTSLVPPSDGGASDASVASDAAVAIPATAAGSELTWFLAAINGAGVANADVTAHFSAQFLTRVSAAQIVATIQQLSTFAHWSLVGFDGPQTETALVAVVRRKDGEYWRISITAQTSPSVAIIGLMLAPAGDLDPSLGTYTEIDSALTAMAPNANLLTASLDGDVCTAIHSLNASSSLALGSAFKLWVLAAVAQSIENGTHAWTESIAIQDKYKSLPSGTLQNEDAGTTLPLLTFADDMISMSDNTAADHLLWTVGRPAVEAMLGTTKHHDPTLNQPFFTTRELFDIKLLLSPQDQQAFIAKSVADKRTALDTYDSTLDPRTYAGAPWTNPILIDKLEWFATPMDLCNVMLTLKDYGDEAATKNVYDVLAINPGIADTANQFAYVGYKGGSEPGVLEATWLLQRKSDLKWVFFAATLNDTTKPIDSDRAVYVMSAARGILGR